jgi:ribonuclease Z
MLRLCAILLTFVAVSFTAEAARSDAKLFRVTLLGTRSPDPVVNRFSASTLVEAGEQKLLFDAGRGVTIRLWQCQVPLSRIDVVFFTHYHSDHTIGLPDLLLTGWLPSSFGHRVAPLHVVGPVGAKNLLSNLSAAYSADIKGRQEEQHLPPEGVASKVDEFTNDGVVYEKDGVRVTAFEVDHRG